MASKRVYIINEDETAVQVITAEKETLEENLEWIKSGIEMFKVLGDTPHHIKMAEETHASLGKPNELYGVPVIANTKRG